MIRHAFEHNLQYVIKEFNNILLIGTKTEYMNINGNICMDDLNYNISTFANRDAKIFSRFNTPHPNIVKTDNITDNYDLISIFTGNNDADLKTLDLISIVNKKATLIISNSVLDHIIIRNRLIIPVVHDINLVLPSINKFKILPLFEQKYNFNSSHITLKESNKTLYVSRVSPSKVIQSYLKFFMEEDGNYLLLKCDQFQQSKSESYEDPRLFYLGDKIFIMYVKIENYIAGIHTCLRLNISELEVVGHEVKVINTFIPQYANNKLTGPEKNWMFWRLDNGQIHCAYYPTKIIQFDQLDGEGVELPEVIVPEEYKVLIKNLRGSTCGLVEGNKITTIVHDNKYQLYKLIYEVNYDTNQYIISNIDKLNIIDYGFIYACGLSRESNGKLKITGGINDTRGVSFYIED